MRQLHLDFETRSMLDIKNVGLDRYARNAEVFMLAWAFDDGPVKLWVPFEGDPIPEALDEGLEDESVTLVAWNAAFEREIFRHALRRYYAPYRWLDPKVMARYATMPAKLKDASNYLTLDDLAKHDGSRLISKFSKPFKGKFRDPLKYPEEWEQFKRYCMQDVVAERAIQHKLERLFTLTPFERELEILDAEINEYGMPTDMLFVDNARELVAVERKELTAQQKALTGLDNPNSGAQLLPWLKARGYPFSSLGKAKVKLAVEGNALLPEAREAISLRAKLSRSSTKKLDALTDRVGPDGWLRFSYEFMGADRTGRWAGKGVQLQNLPR